MNSIFVSRPKTITPTCSNKTVITADRLIRAVNVYTLSLHPRVKRLQQAAVTLQVDNPITAILYASELYHG